MEILTILASIVLVGGAVLLIASPLFHRTQVAPTAAPGQTLAELEVRYQAALASIKDLMFDYEMGKIRQEDYEKLLTGTKLQAAQIRKEIDRLKQSGRISAAVDTELEALVTQARAQLKKTGSSPWLKEIDRRIERLKTATSNGHITTCPTCNARVMLGDTYCASCGHTLGEVSVPAAAQYQCSACRAPVQPGDAFCASCGAALDPMKLPYGELSAI